MIEIFLDCFHFEQGRFGKTLLKLRLSFAENAPSFHQDYDNTAADSMQILLRNANLETGNALYPKTGIPRLIKQV